MTDTNATVAEIPATEADIRLSETLSEKQKQFKSLIKVEKPYVWKLRLSPSEFEKLEEAIEQSLQSHGGDHGHMIKAEYAHITIMYMAESYKRFYSEEDKNGRRQSRLLEFDTKELKELYKNSGIDKQIFVYNASTDDRTSNRWLESMQALGGLAVRDELRRGEDNPLLRHMCRIFHGEESELDEIADGNRATAVKESIIRRHSLYEYLSCIIQNKDLPFAPEDLEPGTEISQLIERIRTADKKANKDKFDFEWLLTYAPAEGTMTRTLRVKLKPETAGENRQYLSYERLREWGLDEPENESSIEITLRFANGSKTKETGPIFTYHNTGSEDIGFVSINKIEYASCSDVPTGAIDKVQIAIKCGDETKIAQELKPEPDYMQAYALPKTSSEFTTRRNNSGSTMVIFSQNCRPTEQYRGQNLTKIRFRSRKDRNETSEEYSLYVIADKFELEYIDGRKISPPFFNRSGLYQIEIKKYPSTIKYKDGKYVKRTWMDPELEEINEDDVTALFGRCGARLMKYENENDPEGKPVEDCELEWNANGRNYVSWKDKEPEPGLINLRAKINGREILLRNIYYLQFSPSPDAPEPIWRDCKNQTIGNSLDGRLIDSGENPDGSLPVTRTLEIGSEESKISIEVYQAALTRELRQDLGGGKTRISHYEAEDAIKLPLICCSSFTVRDFSEKGVRDYPMPADNAFYYAFDTINDPNVNPQKYQQERSVKDIRPDIDPDKLYIYISTDRRSIKENAGAEMYEWDYEGEPAKAEAGKKPDKTGIVFQSLKDCECPRHYLAPEINYKPFNHKYIDKLDKAACFETAAGHGAYFNMFTPLLMAVKKAEQIEEIFVPLTRKRNYELSEKDAENLRRFALHLHFDWMLLPRKKWLDAIAADSQSERLRAAVMKFFAETDKAADARESEQLKEFLDNLYADFDAIPGNVNETAAKALKLIMGRDEKTALGKNAEMREFLKAYDACPVKFRDMNKAVKH